MARQTYGTALKAGAVINDEYEVLSKLGEGGCGAVWRCRMLKPRKGTDAEVAVKVLEKNGDELRFIREAKVLRKTKHVNVVRLVGSGYHEKYPFIALEFVQGGSVRELMDKRGTMPVDESAWILVQTVRGLKATKTVHRDLKPENLLLTPAKGRVKAPKLIINDIEEGSVVKVADFGLARDVDMGQTRLTNSGQVMGTPVYMSPEQCKSTKNVSFKTDIYAMGILLFEMITGKVPFDGSNAYDIMKKHLEEEPKFPRMDKGARAVIERCLQKQQGKRYPSLRALEKDLCALAGIGNDREGSGGSGGSWISVIVIGIIGLAVMGVIVWVLRDRLFG